MPGYTKNSIVIEKPIDELFHIINKIENWPELHGYNKVELLTKKKLVDGRTKLEFQITGNEEDEHDHDVEHGQTHDHEEQHKGHGPEVWVSQRIIDKKKKSSYAVRLNPVYPFKHWILFVELTQESGGTRMSWIQDFAIDPKTGHTDEEIEGYINKGSVKELEVFKNKIETGIVKDKLHEEYFN